MLSKVLIQIKELEKSKSVDIIFTDLLYIQFMQFLDFKPRLGLYSTNQQDIYDVKNTFKYVKLIDTKLSKKSIQVLITDNEKIARYLIYNNFVKYLIFINGTIENLDNFNHSLSVSTNKFNVYYNTSTYEQQFSNKIYVHNTNMELVAKDNKVNILIPIYNKSEYTLKCLKLIDWYNTDIYDLHLFLIDDGSEERHLSAVEAFCNKKKNLKNINVTLIKNNEHIGYTKLVNKGLKYILSNFPSTYLILMHNDTEVTPNWLDILISGIKDQNIASIPSVSEKIPYAEHCIINLRKKKFLPNLPETFQKLKTPRIAEKLQNLYTGLEIDASPNIFKTEFMCIAFNTLIFQKIGFFDEIYEDGFETDRDFTRRIYEIGYKINYMPAAFVKHTGSTSYRQLFKSYVDILDRRSGRYIQYQLLNAGSAEKIAIYTYNTDENGDPPKYNVYEHEYFDYYYFTVNPDIKADSNWKTFDLNDFKHIMGESVQSATDIVNWLKTHPYLFFRKYKMSLCLNKKFNIIRPLYKFLCTLPLDSNFIFIPFNIHITTVKALCEEHKLRNIDNADNINKLWNFFSDNNFNDSLGTAKSDFILQKYNSAECIKLMNLWWNIMCNYCNIADLSYTFCAYQTKTEFTTIPINQTVLFQNYIK